MQVRLLLVPLLLVLILSSHSPASMVEAANILAFYPFFGRSHWIVSRELLLELAARGHHMTVVSPFVEEETPTTWEQIVVPFHFDVFPSPDSFIDLGSSSPIEQFKHLYSYGEQSCERLLTDDGIKKLLRSGRKFDLFMMEIFFNDCLLSVAHKFNVPAVGTVAMAGGSAWMNDMVGNPFPHAYLPEPTLKLTKKMTLLEKMENLYFSVYMKIYRDFWYLPALDSIIQKHLNDPSMPTMSQVEHNISLMLVNTHVSFYYPRPLVPNMIEVGGMHIQPPKKLPQELQEYMDQAADGVIYFSMGSNVKSSEIPAAQLKAIVSVFSRLKQKVLWKFDLESVPDQPPNLKISKWLPQNDILNHRNTKVFITHGGLMSIQETISAGVPLLGIPVFGDQQANIARAEADGFGILLLLQNITEPSFGWALSELLNNPRYKENVVRRSAIFHDRPEPPLESAVRWVEYVLRHEGARHMRSAALDLSWYQLALLDVLAAVVAVVAAALFAVAVVIKFLLRKVFGGRQTKLAAKKRAKKD